MIRAGTFILEPASGRGSPGSQFPPLRAAQCREALPARRNLSLVRGASPWRQGLTLAGSGGRSEHDPVNGHLVPGFFTRHPARRRTLGRMAPEEERSGDLLDVALRDEIELVSDLVVAASSSPRHFTPAEVDALLGISAGSTAKVDPSAATRRAGSDQ
ncbi:hypothetical protein GCM10027053_45750 [Intrasporangium mesophilum]